MVDKAEVDSPGFQYTASKIPFNARAVWRLLWQLAALEKPIAG
jgi:hypothetical protein